MTKEIIYFYVKGQGWLAGYEEHLPKPKEENPWRYIYEDFDNAFLREMRDYQQRLRREAQQGYNFRNIPLQNIPAPRIQNIPRQRFERLAVERPADYRIWLGEVDTGATTVRQPRDNPPRERTPEELERTAAVRYYPGTDEPPEPIPQVNQHERRANVFQRTIARLRGR